MCLGKAYLKRSPAACIGKCNAESTICLAAFLNRCGETGDRIKDVRISLLSQSLPLRRCREDVAEESSLIILSAEETHMHSNLDEFRAKPGLLFAADRLRELIQFLEREVPIRRAGKHL